jgi:PAS domain S-box-containing protein
MTDTDKTQEQLAQELEMLRARVAELEQIEVERRRWRSATSVRDSLPRLFETAKDGILILDADTGKIADVNPFLIEMLGYSHEDLMGKTLWEIGPFKDIQASRSAFTELQSKEYIRYEDLPLEAKYGRRVNVEFVSNVYLVDHTRVINATFVISQRGFWPSKRCAGRMPNLSRATKNWTLFPTSWRMTSRPRWG